MREEIVAGTILPDYELPDHTDTLSSSNPTHSRNLQPA